MIKNFKFANKPVIFMAGMLLGGLATFFGIQIPWSDLLLKNITKTASVKPAIDPLKNFSLPLNDRITSKIQYYTRPGQKVDLISNYKRSGQYVAMMKAIFEEYNLPQALVFLPILESGFLPESTSRAGAAGLWQIIPATASDYGLKYNRWIDERRDPEKSTIVAAEFLRFLYEQLENWDLALAAYNMGYSDLKRAMRRENTTNYWDLKTIPVETYDFVPSFYAILHILTKPDKHGFDLPEITEPPDYETIELEATFSIEEIARLANVPPSVIKNFNPALIGSIAPSGQYSIKVPAGVKDQFLQQAKANPPDRVEITYMTYRVRRRDTLYKIAQKFGTTVSAILADNNLRSSKRIKNGQLLRISVISVSEESRDTTAATDDSGGSPTASENNQSKFVYTVERDSFSINILARYYVVTRDEILSWNPWLKTEWLHRDDEVVIYKPFEKIITHRATRGDSLWRLARQFNTTVANIKMWNQLRGPRIYPGQRLIVKLV
jgi:membrane-bound lytic murein transglycosylase D